MKQNCQQTDFVSPSGIRKLFSCFAIGVAIDLIFLYMKLLLNSTCPMIHSSIIYIVCIYKYDFVQYSVAS